MKAICFVLTFICYTTIAVAQYMPGNPKPEYKLVQQDTINITGIVYDANGAVVPRLTLYSKNKEFIYSGYYVGTTTDKAGKFILKGALFHDTLRISPSRDFGFSFVINGSRYVEIHLPAAYNQNNLTSTVEVTATRKHIKKIPKFKVVTNETILDYYGIVAYTEGSPAGEKEKYMALVKSKVAYPPKAIENNIEGEVEIAFIIERDGSLSNYKIIKGIGYGCEEAVINALKSSPKWYPALTPLGSRVIHSSITINFTLTNK